MKRSKKFGFVITIGICFLTLSASSFAQSNTTIDSYKYTIYLVKQMWHTGIVFKLSEIDSSIWPEIKYFQEFKYIDVGWGDSAFYQDPDFNLVLAAEALFVPTPSTLRIEGLFSSIYNYIKSSDKAIEIKLTESQLNSLCKYIHDNYYRNKQHKLIVYGKEEGGKIIFYKANGKYDLFNTCNTWVAKGLRKAGFKNIDDNLILVKELFQQAGKIGKVLK